MTNTRGFTIVEVLVALMMLSVGLMGLASSWAVVTRMTARGQRSAVATQFARQRLDRLWATGCSVRAAGADTLYRGGSWVAINSWTWSTLAGNAWQASLTLTYKTGPGKQRTESLVTEVSCVR
jgi:prepilin-type N-terminal cleavage/methylation domain-containing protein